MKSYDMIEINILLMGFKVLNHYDQERVMVIVMFRVEPRLMWFVIDGF